MWCRTATGHFHQKAGSNEPGSSTDHLSVAMGKLFVFVCICSQFSLQPRTALTLQNPHLAKPPLPQNTHAEFLASHFKFRSALALFSGTCATPSTSKGSAAASASSVSAEESGGAGRRQPVKAPSAVHQRPERKILSSTRSPGQPHLRRSSARELTPNKALAAQAAAKPGGPKKWPNCSAMPGRVANLHPRGDELRW